MGLGLNITGVSLNFCFFKDKNQTAINHNNEILIQCVIGLRTRVNIFKFPVVIMLDNTLKNPGTSQLYPHSGLECSLLNGSTCCLLNRNWVLNSVDWPIFDMDFSLVVCFNHIWLKFPQLLNKCLLVTRIVVKYFHPINKLYRDTPCTLIIKVYTVFTSICHINLAIEYSYIEKTESLYYSSFKHLFVYFLDKSPIKSSS